MDLKFLKIGTVIAYLCITWAGAHIGGPFGLCILLGLFSIQTILISALFLTVLIAFLYSANNAFKKYELEVFLVGGLILSIPIISHAHTVLVFFERKDDTFFLTLIPFILLYGIILFKIQKQRNHDNKEKV